jgi:hypothetical protein
LPETTNHSTIVLLRYIYLMSKIPPYTLIEFDLATHKFQSPRFSRLLVNWTGEDVILFFMNSSFYIT